MPLSINVGLSHKASRNYQSTGVSINVTAELDQALLARPEALQQQIAGLYAQAKSALQAQAERMGRPQTPPHPRENTRQAHPANTPARQADPYAPARNGGGMTQSQRRAILAIAGRLNLDVQAECRGIADSPFEQLSVREASTLIDHLKALPAPSAGNGRGAAQR